MKSAWEEAPQLMSPWWPISARCPHRQASSPNPWSWSIIFNLGRTTRTHYESLELTRTASTPFLWFSCSRLVTFCLFIVLNTKARTLFSFIIGNILQTEARILEKHLMESSSLSVAIQASVLVAVIVIIMVMVIIMVVVLVRKTNSTCCKYDGG